MRCVNCEKESNNLRVCPYCFTPYQEEEAGPARRPTRRTSALGGSGSGSGSGFGTGTQPAARPSAGVSGLMAAFMRQSPVVRWSSVGILAVLILWIATSPGDATFEPGKPTEQVIATAMQRDEALAVIRQTRELALVDVQQDEVFVSYPAATFPVREEGQLALVQRFAEADALVEGRRRRIFFYNPNGKLFAQSDASRGVILAR